MKIETYTYPHSTFLAMDKDMELIVTKLLKNERLKKLLYYDVSDALKQPNVSQDKALAMFGNQIKIVPKLYIDAKNWCYINIVFDRFMPNETNPAFRDNIIQFDIVCHFNQWNLGNFQLRPYKIAAELDTMFNNKRLTGIGKTQFYGANRIILNNEFSGLSVKYWVTHGIDGEDSKKPLNPMEQNDLINNFNEIFNNDNGL